MAHRNLHCHTIIDHHRQHLPSRTSALGPLYSLLLLPMFLFVAAAGRACPPLPPPPPCRSGRGRESGGGQTPVDQGAPFALP